MWGLGWGGVGARLESPLQMLGHVSVGSRGKEGDAKPRSNSLALELP